MMKKILIRSILAIILLLTVLLFTPVGLNTTLKFASAMLPGKITYTKASGTLTGSIKITQLKYTSNNTQLSIKQLKMTWKPFQLLRRKITITTFHADQLRLTLGFAKKVKTATTSPRKDQQRKKTTPPYLLNIQNADINYLAIRTKHHENLMEIRHVSLDARITPDLVQIQSQVNMTKPIRLRTEFNIHGNPDRYTIFVKLIGDHLNWRLYGLGNTQGVFVNLNEGKTLGGKLSLSANLHWLPQWDWGLNLNGSHLNLSQIHRKMATNVNIRIHSKGVIGKHQPKFTLKSLITAANTYIKITTSQQNKINLKWDIKVAKLSTLWKDFRGAIQSQGEWTPDTTHPVIQGHITANEFSLLGYQASQLNSQWTLFPKQQKISTFHINAADLKGPKFQLKRLKLTGKGTQQKQKIDGQIGHHNNAFSFQLQGSYLNKAWKGQLKKFLIHSQRYPDWQLKRPAKLSLSNAHVTASHICLQAKKQPGVLCVGGTWNANTPWQLSAKGQHFNLAFLSHLVVPQLAVNSPTHLTAIITGNGPHIDSATANIQLEKGQLAYKVNSHAMTSPIQQGKVSIKMQGNTVDAHASLRLTKENQIQLTIKKTNQQLSGTLNAAFSDLSPLNQLTKAIQNPSGNLTANLTLSGQLPTPNISGQIRFDHGNLFLPKLGIKLSKINAQIIQRPHGLDYKMIAYSKDQPIKVNGLATWTGAKKILSSTNTLDGSHVLLMNTPEYRIQASPHLKVDIRDDTIHLTGKIDIPQGIIQPHEFTNVISIPSHQIEYIGAHPDMGDSRWKTSAHLDISLGKDVQVKTSGFNATVTGRATLIGEPDHTTLANGRINVVTGHYNAYGTSLVITPGSFIQFINSPVANPHLNIRATKIIQVSGGSISQLAGLNNITAGVNLSGSFRQLKIRLFSIPATLSQADILSYLLLGYASENATGGNIGLLVQAASTLQSGGKGAGIGGAISEIKQSLGITELGVESQTLMNTLGGPIEQQSSFVIGKRLTKNLYIRYSQGLGQGQGPFVPVNIFQLRYNLSDHWLIQTDSSTLGNGADVLYTIQKD
jgi:autotransporter translocation and assembly factor TamB